MTEKLDSAVAAELWPMEAGERMPKRPCIGCGALSEESYCARHRPKRKWDERRGRSGWDASRFRAAVLARSDGRCVVCGSTDRVEAHHVVAVSDGGGNDPANGVALCWRHHRSSRT